MSPRTALAALCLALLACACTPGGPAASARAPTPAQAPAAVDAGALAIDRSCRVAADCEVKNVGNCCGYAPACVNRDAVPDPDAVRARCARSGIASICGWQEIQACDCVQGRCEAVTGPPMRER